MRQILGSFHLHPGGVRKALEDLHHPGGPAPELLWLAGFGCRGCGGLVRGGVPTERGKVKAPKLRSATCRFASKWKPPKQWSPFDLPKKKHSSWVPSIRITSMPESANILRNKFSVRFHVGRVIQRQGPKWWDAWCFPWHQKGVHRFGCTA